MGQLIKVANTDSTPETRQYLTFTLANEHFAVGTLSVKDDHRVRPAHRRTDDAAEHPRGDQPARCGSTGDQPRARLSGRCTCIVILLDIGQVLSVEELAVLGQADPSSGTAGCPDTSVRLSIVARHL